MILRRNNLRNKSPKSKISLKNIYALSEKNSKKSKDSKNQKKSNRQVRIASKTNKQSNEKDLTKKISDSKTESTVRGKKISQEEGTGTLKRSRKYCESKTSGQLKCSTNPEKITEHKLCDKVASSSEISSKKLKLKTNGQNKLVAQRAVSYQNDDTLSSGQVSKASNFRRKLRSSTGSSKLNDLSAVKQSRHSDSITNVELRKSKVKRNSDALYNNAEKIDTEIHDSVKKLNDKIKFTSNKVSSFIDDLFHVQDSLLLNSPILSLNTYNACCKLRSFTASSNKKSKKISEVSKKSIKRQSSIARLNTRKTLAPKEFLAKTKLIKNDHGNSKSKQPKIKEDEYDFKLNSQTSEKSSLGQDHSKAHKLSKRISNISDKEVNDIENHDASNTLSNIKTKSGKRLQKTKVKKHITRNSCQNVENIELKKPNLAAKKVTPSNKPIFSGKEEKKNKSLSEPKAKKSLTNKKSCASLRTDLLSKNFKTCVESSPTFSYHLNNIPLDDLTIIKYGTPSPVENLFTTGLNRKLSLTSTPLVEKDSVCKKKISSKSLSDGNARIKKRLPGKRSLKYKRLAINSLKVKNNGYEDDLFENCDLKAVPFMLDESDLSDVSIATPKCPFLITPKIRSKTPQYSDCYNPAELLKARKVAEEYMHRRKKKRSCSSVKDSSAEREKKRKKEISVVCPEKKRLEFQNMVDTLAQRCKSAEFIDESEDEYFNDISF